MGWYDLVVAGKFMITSLLYRFMKTLEFYKFLHWMNEWNSGICLMMGKAKEKIILLERDMSVYETKLFFIGTGSMSNALGK